jgi:hypothetical protein
MKKTVKKFQTPHEAARTKADKKAAVGKAPAKDAFGGRIGSRMSAINLCVIKAGKKGATVPQVAAITKESAGIVSAQLGWMFSHAKVCTRNVEKADNGRETFRYFAKL